MSHMNTPQALRSRRRLAVMVGILGVSILLAQLYKDQIMALVGGHPELTRITPPPCDLNRSACPLPIITPVLSEAPWTFAISPRPIPVSAPLWFTLTPPKQILSTNQPETAWVELTGDSMDMGLIRIPLEADAAGNWSGQGSVPICVTGKMRWRARLYLKLANTTVEADWLFDAPIDPVHRPN